MATWKGKDGSERFGLALSPELKREIEFAAVVAGVSINEWIRDAIYRKLGTMPAK